MAQQVKWLEEAPLPDTFGEVQPRKYGYALIYIDSITASRRGQIEVSYAVVKAELMDAILPPAVEQALFARWMMRYPFNMQAGYGIEFDFLFEDRDGIKGWPPWPSGRRR
jgi:hypothetical protein